MSVPPFWPYGYTASEYSGEYREIPMQSFESAFMYDEVLPTVIVCALDGTALVELKITFGEVELSLNEPTEATFTVNTYDHAAEVDDWLQPWASTVVVVIEGAPVWGGTVVKRRIDLGENLLEIVCREWTGWLDRVWTTATTEYASPPSPDDAATVIKQRIDSAVTLFPDCPLAGMDWLGGTVGIPAEIDFEDQSEETSPDTFLSQLSTLSGLGVDWRILWTVDNTNKFKAQLWTGRFDAEALSMELVVGGDVVSAKLEVDSDPQVTTVKVIGMDFDGVAATDPEPVPLWKVSSFDKVGETQEVVDELAEALRRQLAQPLVTVSDVKLSTMQRRYFPGQLVTLVIPPDFDRRYPTGLDVLSRVSMVKWSWKANDKSTELTLSALWDDIPNAEPAPPKPGFVGTLRALQERLIRVEARRVRI